MKVFIKKLFIGIIVLGFFLPQAVLGEEDPISEELETLLEEAKKSNPEIQAAWYRNEAALARIPQALALEDPRLGFQITNIPINDFSFDKTPMSGKDFSFQQKIPFPSKLHFRKKAEQTAQASTKSFLEETVNRIYFKIQKAYYELYRLDKEIKIVRKNKALLKNLSRVAEFRYTTGQASGPDVFRAQTFRDELSLILLTLEQERASMLVRMNTLLNRPANFVLNLSYGFLLSKPPSRPDGDWEIKKRPLLVALERRIKEADYRIRLARQDYLPDFDFGVSYRQRDLAPGDPVNGTDFITGSVKVTVPLWAYWRQSKKVKETKAQKMALQYQYQAAVNESTYEVENTYRQLGRLYRQINLFKKALLPETRATYNSSFTAYEAGRVGFFPTIEALKDQHEMELAFYDLKSAYEISLAQLEWILGENFSPGYSEVQ